METRLRSLSGKSRAGAGFNITGTSARAAQFGGGQDGFDRRFELHQYNAGADNCLLRFRRFRREKRAIGAASHGDGILAVFGHEDKGHARRRSFIASHILNIDAILQEARNGFLAEYICPTWATKVMSPPARAAATAWLAPFASRRHGKLAPNDGFAGLRDAVDLDDHIGVRTAHNKNFGLLVMELK